MSTKKSDKIFFGIKLEKLDASLIENVKNLYLAGNTTWQVAKILGIDQSKTRRILRATGVKMRLKGDYPPQLNTGKYAGFGDILPHTIRSLHNCARNRNIEVHVTAEELWNLFIKQDKKCALSNLPIEFAKRYIIAVHGGGTASLDRIDSKKHYTIDNVQWVHKDINKMKQDLNEDYFIKLCSYIIKNKGDKY